MKWNVTVTTFQNVEIEADSREEAREKARTIHDDNFDSSQVEIIVGLIGLDGEENN